MEIRIRGTIEQIRKIVPIINEMEEKQFIMWDYPDFIAPFQYGNNSKETALIKITKKGNLIVEYMQS